MTSARGVRTSWLLGGALIFLANFLGGASYPVQKWGLTLFPAGTLTFLRNGSAVVPLLVILWLRRRRLVGWSAGELGRAALVGTLGFAVPLVLGCEGVERSTSINASLLILLEPLTILLFAWLLLREHIAPSQIAGVLLGIAGAVVLVLDAGSPGLTDTSHLTGNLLLAASAVAWGLYTPLAKPLLARHDPFAVTAVTVAFSLVLLGPYALLERGDWPAAWSMEATWMLLVLGGLIAFVGTVAWIAALDHLPASWVAPFLLVQPLAGTLGGVVWFDERLTTTVLAGGGLIVLGLASTLVSARLRRRRARRAARQLPR
ncbi:MAG: DMT family transporter [Planctomycetota bacterium]